MRMKCTSLFLLSWSIAMGGLILSCLIDQPVVAQETPSSILNPAVREKTVPPPGRAIVKPLPGQFFQKVPLKQAIIASDTMSNITEQDEWLAIVDLEGLLQLRLEGHGSLEKSHLQRAIEHIKRNLKSRLFIARLRARGQALVPHYWTARGNAYQLVNLYQAFENGPASCMAALLPTPRDENALDTVSLTTGQAGPPPRQIKALGDRNALSGTRILLQDSRPVPAQDRDQDKPDRWKPPKIKQPERPQIPQEPIILTDPNDEQRCGTISTIRSLLKMKWIKEADVVTGDKLNAAYVKKFDKYLKGGLNLINLAKAHKDHMPAGHTFLKKDFNINMLTAKDSKKNWEQIQALLKQGWDCIAIYTASVQMPDGKTRNFSHGEMVTGVKISKTAPTGVTLELADALDQGTGSGKGISRTGTKTTKPYQFDHKKPDGTMESPLIVQCYFSKKPKGD